MTAAVRLLRLLMTLGLGCFTGRRVPLLYALRPHPPPRARASPPPSALATRAQFPPAEPKARPPNPLLRHKASTHPAGAAAAPPSATTAPPLQSPARAHTDAARPCNARPLPSPHTAAASCASPPLLYTARRRCPPLLLVLLPTPHRRNAIRLGAAAAAWRAARGGRGARGKSRQPVWRARGRRGGGGPPPPQPPSLPSLPALRTRLVDGHSGGKMAGGKENVLHRGEPPPRPRDRRRGTPRRVGRGGRADFTAPAGGGGAGNGAEGIDPRGRGQRRHAVETPDGVARQAPRTGPVRTHPTVAALGGPRPPMPCPLPTAAAPTAARRPPACPPPPTSDRGADDTARRPCLGRGGGGPRRPRRICSISRFGLGLARPRPKRGSTGRIAAAARHASRGPRRGRHGTRFAGTMPRTRPPPPRLYTVLLPDAVHRCLPRLRPLLLGAGGTRGRLPCCH